MRRPVCWVEKLDDGVKREVRVMFEGGGRIRWQAKRSDQEHWIYDVVATDEEWAELESNMERRYRRRNVPLKDVELVKKLRASR